MPDLDRLRGVYNITPTPFHPDGSLDEASLGALTQFNIDCGVQGMTILGVMGEASKVSDAERTRAIATVIEAADGRLPICVGATHAATDVCVQYSREAEALGAVALMIAPPRLSRTNDDALRRHYLTVAEAVGLPIFVQDHPPSSGVFMTVDFLVRLAAEAPQCRLIKMEDEPTAPKIGRLLEADPDLFIVGGTGGLWFIEELRRGAQGIMTGFGYPDILADIYRRWTTGDHDSATEIFYRYLPLIRFENQPGLSLAVRKHVYTLRGAIKSPQAREPYTRMDNGTRADLADLLTRLGLMEDPHQIRR